MGQWMTAVVSSLAEMPSTSVGKTSNRSRVIYTPFQLVCGYLPRSHIPQGEPSLRALLNPPGFLLAPVLTGEGWLSRVFSSLWRMAHGQAHTEQEEGRVGMLWAGLV